MLVAASLVGGRGTATPDGTADLVHVLPTGALPAPASAAFRPAAMARTAAFPDRPVGRTPPGWTLAHTTDAAPTRGGANHATNAVGIPNAPDGVRIALSVCPSDSRRPPEEWAALVAAGARPANGRSLHVCPGPSAGRPLAAARRPAVCPV